MEQDLEFIRTEINDLSWHLNRARGVFDRLDKEINRGRWLHAETCEAADLLNSAAELRKIADQLLSKRNSLIANMPQLVEAAE